MSHLRIAHIYAIAQSAVTTYKKVIYTIRQGTSKWAWGNDERGIRWGNSQLCGDQIEVLAEVQAQLVVQSQLSTATSRILKGSKFLFSNFSFDKTKEDERKKNRKNS